MLLFQGLSAQFPFTVPSLCTASHSKGWPGPSAGESATVQQSQLLLTRQTHWPTSLSLRENTFWHSQLENECPRPLQPRMTEKEADQGACNSSGAPSDSPVQRSLGPCHSHFLSFWPQQEWRTLGGVCSWYESSAHPLTFLSSPLFLPSLLWPLRYHGWEYQSQTHSYTDAPLLLLCCFAPALFYRPAASQSRGWVVWAMHKQFSTVQTAPQSGKAPAHTASHHPDWIFAKGAADKGMQKNKQEGGRRNQDFLFSLSN